MERKNMNSDERSLLLFLEARAVDYGGRVHTRHMNADDMKLALRWNEEGFIQFGRIVMRHHNRNGTHFVVLSEEAWSIAHNERRARNERMWLKRNWLSTSENIETHPGFGDFYE